MSGGLNTIGNLLGKVNANNELIVALASGSFGSDTQVLFNDSGTIAGDAGLTFNKTSNVLTVTGSVDVGTMSLDAAQSALFATSGNMIIGTNAAGTVTLRTSASGRWRWDADGHFRALGAFKIVGGGVVSPLVTVTTITTAGAVTYSAAEVAGGLILRDCNGAGRADLVPTAANLLAEFPGAQIGQGYEFTIRNTSGTAVSITVTTNTGVTLSGTMTIAQNNTKRFLARFTNVTAASEAYTLYSLGTVVH